MQLTWNGKALVATLLFRLLFGGYIVAMDQYSFNDPESAMTVVATYALIATFATLFLFGKKIGIMGLVGFEAVYLVINSVFFVLSLSQIIDPGLCIVQRKTGGQRYFVSFFLLSLLFGQSRPTKKQKRMNKSNNESCCMPKIWTS